MYPTLLIKLMMIFIQLHSLINAKDADCAIKQTSISELDCQGVKTGTSNTCCYMTFSSGGADKCITADNSSPQTLVTSIETIQLTNPNSSVKCGKNAEKCSSIASPANFASCNITELEYPFSCCFMETSTIKRCYPVNARYNTTVAYDAERLKTHFNYTEVPKIICSTVDLPVPANSHSLQIKYMQLIVVMLFILFI